MPHTSKFSLPASMRFIESSDSKPLPSVNCIEKVCVFPGSNNPSTLSREKNSFATVVIALL